MEAPKHTPTPWRTTGGIGDGGYIASSGHGYVPIITPFTEKANRDKHGGPTPEAKANADFIVRAVNAHDDLVAALQAVMRCARSEIERPLTQRAPWAEAERLIEVAMAKVQTSLGLDPERRP